MGNDEFQFYPTPEALAKRAIEKFRNKDFVRVIEPSAGDGALAKALKESREGGWSRRQVDIDCIEIDISKHPALRSENLNVVGIDFLKFKAGSQYSHALMNPPFSEGARHVLHAWDILEEAEIVAIVNAETIRNPYSREREQLVRLIEQHGEVEFISDAFNGPYAERKTDVEVALIWLKKDSKLASEIVGEILDNLKQDRGPEMSYEDMQAVALPNSTIDNAVLVFKAAVEATRQSIIAEARANHYAEMLGEKYSTVRGEEGATSETLEHSKEWVKREMNKRYDGLKDRAWTGILSSTQVSSKLSSAAQGRLEAEFQKIKTLEFTQENIYGFLLGLAEKQGEIQIQMVCDVFDAISMYHTDNAHFYLGWKSNDQHRTCGMKIKAKRFVLPHHKTESHQQKFSWDTEKLLHDFDKVFAMMDGEEQPAYSLLMAARQNFNALRNGARIESTYFGIRHYPGIGTIHFFPTRPDLVDRLNRTVGRYRRWLPPEGVKVPEDFWLQVDKCEKFDKDFRAEAYKSAGRWNDPFWKMRTGYGDEKERANTALVTAMSAVLNKHGIDPDALLEEDINPQLKLLAA